MCEWRAVSEVAKTLQNQAKKLFVRRKNGWLLLLLGPYVRHTSTCTVLYLYKYNLQVDYELLLIKKLEEFWNDDYF